MYGLQPILPSTDLDHSTFDDNTKSELLVQAVTRWKGNKTSHTVQKAFATEATSPSSNTHPAFNQSVRSGKVLRRWTEEEDKEEEKTGLEKRLMGNFYRLSQREAQCCLEHGQRLKALWSACKSAPGTEDQSIQPSLKKMMGLKWQSQAITPFIAVRVNKT